MYVITSLYGAPLFNFVTVYNSVHSVNTFITLNGFLELPWCKAHSDKNIKLSSLRFLIITNTANNCRQQVDFQSKIQVGCFNLVLLLLCKQISRKTHEPQDLFLTICTVSSCGFGWFWWDGVDQLWHTALWLAHWLSQGLFWTVFFWCPCSMCQALSKTCCSYHFW